MKLTEREVKGVTVLGLHGDIRIGDGSELFDAAVQRLIAARRTNILLDMAHTGYVDSIGFNEIALCRSRVERRGGKLKVVNTNAQVARFLRITGLVWYIETFTDEAEAIASFGEPRPASAA